MKEYLVKNIHGKYKVTDHHSGFSVEDLIEIPEGACIARFYPKDPVGLEFENSSHQWWDDEKLEWVDYSSTEYFNSSKFSRIAWQRPTHPEPLPFIDDNTQSLNDQYAEIEQVRQDVINNPNHYTSGGIECLDAMQAMLGRDEFIGFLRGNIFKYNWRYQLKNGVEDLKKAQFYQNKLIELESDDAI